MSVTKLTNDTFEKEALAAGKPVLVDFYADCPLLRKLPMKASSTAFAS